MYIHFTEAQKQAARETDLVAFLQRRGEVLKRSGSEYEWRDGAQKVTIRGNVWFHQYERVGGDAIDFVRRFYGMDYPQAVELLLDGHAGFERPTQHATIQQKPTKKFLLPKRNNTMHRVYAYLLQQRGIDREVLNAFVREGMIYESPEHHNAVFVGYDQNGVPRHAHKRGTNSQSNYKGNQDGSRPECSFHWHGQSNRLYFFEAPIDLLSYVSMHKENWQEHSYAAACGVSDHVLWQMMKDHPNIDHVCLGMDNDEAGQSAARHISEKLNTHGISNKVLIPTRKDWNEDILHSREVLCPTLQF